MTVLYAVICRSSDAVILTEVCDKDIKGSVGPVFLELLQHLRDHPNFVPDGSMKTFVQRNQLEIDFFSNFLEACSAAIGEAGDQAPDHYFHLFHKNEVYYGCLGDDSDTRDQKVNFAFLEHIQKEFTKMYRPGRIKSANAYSLEKDFGPTIRSAMHYHNIHHKEIRQEEKVTQMLTQVQDIREVMGRNLDLILDRGDRFDTLLQKSTALCADVQVFKKNARTTRHIMCRRYYSTYAALVGLIILIMCAATVFACGFTLQRCMRTENGSNNNDNGGGGDDMNNN